MILQSVFSRWTTLKKRKILRSEKIIVIAVRAIDHIPMCITITERSYYTFRELISLFLKFLK